LVEVVKRLSSTFGYPRGGDGEKGRLQSEAMSDDYYYYYSRTWWRGWSRRSRARNVDAGILNAPSRRNGIAPHTENGRAETLAANLCTAQTCRAYCELFFKHLTPFFVRYSSASNACGGEACEDLKTTFLTDQTHPARLPC